MLTSDLSHCPARVTKPLRRLALVVATIGGLNTSFGAEPVSVASPEYRLSIKKFDMFRLADKNASSPLSGSKRRSTTVAQIADQPFAAEIDKAARESALDPALVHALIYVESRYQPTARSPKGALGLMQVLPETAIRYGVANVEHSVDANLKVGTRYLRDLLVLFEGHLDLALAAYNAGENAVLRYGQRIPPYRETREYVPAVIAKYREWRGPPFAAAPVQRRVEYLPGTVLEPAVVPGFRP
jgi:soluble lytic murein transglycosylase-like protein